MHSDQIGFSEINIGKADFDRIYDQPDPREYFRVLYGLDYVIPELARAPFDAIFRALRAQRNGRLKIADLGCSYGINAALLRYPVDMSRLAKRYGTRELQHLESGNLADLDRNYFNSWPLQSDDTYIGIDTALPAVQYALRAGLIDGAVTTNLEQRNANTGDVSLLRGLSIIISTGCIGYTTEKSLQRILALQPRPTMPWVANLVLRMFPYDAIAAGLEQFGLVTEKLEGVTFVQRRFHSREEFDNTIATLRRLGIDPAGKEESGLFHAELYLSRPAAEVEQKKLSEIVSVTSGANRNYGQRFMRDDSGETRISN
jgi:hypothetical protein